MGGWRKFSLRSRRRKSFLFYALGSIGTFAMAARAVHWLDGPQWLGLAFIGVGLALGVYYLGRALRGRRSRGGAGRR
ncbi:MAG: hypothetical protein JWM13_3246 [Arthrobacter sp.]|nr:hypothetical protein [Arthrobacter sp.]